MKKTRLYFDWMHTFGSSSVCGIFLLTGKRGTGGSCHRRRRSVWYVFTGKGSTIEIQDGNRLRIQNGQAKNGVGRLSGSALRTPKAISRTGESIICLPNQVVSECTGQVKRVNWMES